ncbi:16S rRNA (uracil(1498)-N(3))-methyltransferase [Actinokineospora globicatena]|uniref:16S rRNA (uracil(1498)-N(3))-methyltransferase n=1 Tax=Actinokineospora globicatena TaxID=103729 RepID=UPI0020A4BC4F|nr:16S rRNA (uracil(1498)-N(3))-methyltransferase [Actinokineospora globicatena]MCP2305306.1 16S rRNA (uracil1498-N3)-methyltransferase [Actinokineospora globicatena]GLW80783.1 ribosomal RNA small subunit methyltransferase E [Actinokineospora globicatena]GLW87610.1 ribosomal RNA small subunit methyltransferase E [Actinokineospora globicatena]
MTLAQFLVDALPAAGPFTLDGPEGRHAAAVRRLRAGERLLVGDGAGSVAECVVTAAAKDSLDVVIERRWTEPPPDLRVVLVQALVKGDRGELAVELATEAGVDAVVPWRACRCVAKWEDGPRGEKALARWRSTAREAAKQARRPWVPDVLDPVGQSGLLDLVRASALTLVLEAHLATRLAQVRLPESGDLVLVVGPEGGISPDELTALEQAGATAVRLGPAVLRTSTAAAVALGALGALTARWR